MIQVCTDHSTWCDKCGQYLSAANPGVRVFDGERAGPPAAVLCLECIERMRDALMVQAQEDKAREIRSKSASGLFCRHDLATEYNVSEETIGNIKARRTWKHLP